MGSRANTELLLALLNDPGHPLAEPLAQWLEQSPRFVSFATNNRSKIRKKITGARDAGSLHDLLFELAVAQRLLNERRITLVYEPLGQGKTRGPDFAATFHASYVFAVEATRMREPQRPGALQAEQPDAATSLPLAQRRLADVIATKLGQLLPQQPNLLVLGSTEFLFDDATLTQAMRRLLSRAEQREPGVYARSGLRNPAEFFGHFCRLSALALVQPNTATLFWHNPQARQPLPPDLRLALVRCLTPEA